jgi:dolichol-phosphate mannosyltransferase
MADRVADMRARLGSEIEISIVVPTLNEARNLPALAARIDAALAGRSYELLIIDDAGGDETPDVCAELSERFPIYLHVRQLPLGGLSGAVICGLDRARGELLVVMDADLQHPPESIPDLLAPLEQGDVEFVIGSRNVPGAQVDQRWGSLRRINSGVASLLARPFAGQTRDPMSGFFALRAETFARAGQLNPTGYKIGLELLCKCRVRRIKEIPIAFGLRTAGESKLNLRQQLHFIDHLSRLYDFCFPRATAWTKFAILNTCAWLVAFGIYVKLVSFDVNAVVAPSIAFIIAIGASAIFQMRAMRFRRAVGRGWIDFALVSLAQWSVCTLSARWLAVHVLTASFIEIFSLTFGAAGVVGSIVQRQLLMISSDNAPITLDAQPTTVIPLHNAA